MTVHAGLTQAGRQVQVPPLTIFYPKQRMLIPSAGTKGNGKAKPPSGEREERDAAMLLLMGEYKLAGKERRLNIEDEICDLMEKPIGAALAQLIVKVPSVRRDRDDIMQEARIRAVHCIRNYNGTSVLSNYIYSSVLGEFLHYIRDHGHPIKLSREVKENLAKVANAANALRRENGGEEPTVEEIAQALGLKEELVAEVLAANEIEITSIDADRDIRGNGGRGRISELTEDVGARAPDAILGEMVAADFVRRTCSGNKQVQAVMLHIIGSKTQSEVAKIMGTSQMQVSRHIERWKKVARTELPALYGGTVPAIAPAGTRRKTAMAAARMGPRKAPAINRAELFRKLIMHVDMKDGRYVLQPDKILSESGLHAQLEQVERLGGREKVAQMMSKRYSLEILPA